MVEERLEVEAVEIQGPVADGVGDVTSLVTYASDLGNFVIHYHILF